MSLIEAHEMIDLRVENLSEGVRAHDMRWHHLPIVDQSTPDEVFEAAWATTLPVLAKALQEGRGVLVHCKGGLGRAGTIAAALLLMSDETMTSTEAIERVRAVRPGAIENRMQEIYVTALRD